MEPPSNPGRFTFDETDDLDRLGLNGIELAIHLQTNAVRGYKISKKTFEKNKAKLAAERTYSKLGFSEIDELIKNIFD